MPFEHLSLEGGENNAEKVRKIVFIGTQQVDIKGSFPPFYAPAPERFSSRGSRLLTAGFIRAIAHLKKYYTCKQFLSVFFIIFLTAIIGKHQMNNLP